MSEKATEVARRRLRRELIDAVERAEQDGLPVADIVDEIHALEDAIAATTIVTIAEEG